MCGRQGVGGGHPSIRLDAGSFPACVGDRIDRRAPKDADDEVVGDRVTGYGVGSAAGGLAYDRSPLLGLQVVAELLGSEEGAACGKA